MKKFAARNPKFETNSNFLFGMRLASQSLVESLVAAEVTRWRDPNPAQNPPPQVGGYITGIRASDFEFVSNFGFRISSFPSHDHR
jgi:hypothetical protein